MKKTVWSDDSEWWCDISEVLLFLSSEVYLISKSSSSFHSSSVRALPFSTVIYAATMFIGLVTVVLINQHCLIHHHNNTIALSHHQLLLSSPSSTSSSFPRLLRCPRDHHCFSLPRLPQCLRFSPISSFQLSIISLSSRVSLSFYWTSSHWNWRCHHHHIYDNKDE